MWDPNSLSPVMITNASGEEWNATMFSPTGWLLPPNSCDYSKSPILHITFIIFPWSFLFWPSGFHLQFYTFHICISVISELHFLSDYYRGGKGKGLGGSGADGTISGKACPKGLYGTFCEVYKYIFKLPNYVIIPYLINVLASFYSRVLLWIRPLWMAPSIKY